VKKSSNLFEDWVATKIGDNIMKSSTYCRYMGYSRPDQLLYAVAAGDTPAEVTVAVRSATKALGSEFSKVLQKELSK
jgi:hypothetical protein